MLLRLLEDLPTETLYVRKESGDTVKVLKEKLQSRNTTSSKTALLNEEKIKIYQDN